VPPIQKLKRVPVTSPNVGQQRGIVAVAIHDIRNSPEPSSQIQRGHLSLTQVYVSATFHTECCHSIAQITSLLPPHCKWFTLLSGLYSFTIANYQPNVSRRPGLTGQMSWRTAGTLRSEATSLLSNPPIPPGWRGPHQRVPQSDDGPRLAAADQPRSVSKNNLTEYECSQPRPRTVPEPSQNRPRTTASLSWHIGQCSCSA